jgi:predicted O-linked N-acetylglucosamine transferase (SPINDLY family)
MPELSVKTLADYEEFAVRIGGAESEALMLRARLNEQIKDAPEFDPDLKTSSLERLYIEAHVGGRRG